MSGQSVAEVIVRIKALNQAGPGIQEVTRDLQSGVEAVRQWGLAMAGFGRATIDAASSVEQYQARLATLFKSVDVGKEKYKELVKFADATPFDTDGVVRAATQLKAYGQDIDQWLTKAGDMAAAMGRDLPTAAEALGKALSGNAEGFEILANQFGITKQALREFGANVNEQGQLLLAGERNTERARQALEKFIQANFAGGMASQANSIANTVSNLESAFTQFKAAIGQTLAPIVTPFLQEMTKLLKSFNEAGPALRGLGAGVVAAGSALGGLAATILTLRTGMAAFGIASTGAMGTVSAGSATAAAGLAGLAGPIGLAVVGVQTLAIAVLEAYRQAALAKEAQYVKESRQLHGGGGLKGYQDLKNLNESDPEKIRKMGISIGDLESGQAGAEQLASNEATEQALVRSRQKDLKRIVDPNALENLNNELLTLKAEQLALEEGSDAWIKNRKEQKAATDAIFELTSATKEELAAKKEEYAANERFLVMSQKREQVYKADAFNLKVAADRTRELEAAEKNKARTADQLRQKIEDAEHAYKTHAGTLVQVRDAQKAYVDELGRLAKENPERFTDQYKKALEEFHKTNDQVIEEERKERDAAIQFEEDKQKAREQGMQQWIETTRNAARQVAELAAGEAANVRARLGAKTAAGLGLSKADLEAQLAADESVARAQRDADLTDLDTSATGRQALADKAKRDSDYQSLINSGRQVEAYKLMLQEKSDAEKSYDSDRRKIEQNFLNQQQEFNNQRIAMDKRMHDQLLDQQRTARQLAERMFDRESNLIRRGMDTGLSVTEGAELGVGPGKLDPKTAERLTRDNAQKRLNSALDALDTETAQGRKGLNGDALAQFELNQAEKKRQIIQEQNDALRDQLQQQQDLLQVQQQQTAELRTQRGFTDAGTAMANLGKEFRSQFGLSENGKIAGLDNPIGERSLPSPTQIEPRLADTRNAPGGKTATPATAGPQNVTNNVTMMFGDQAQPAGSQIQQLLQKLLDEVGRTGLFDNKVDLNGLGG